MEKFFSGKNFSEYLFQEIKLNIVDLQIGYDSIDCRQEYIDVLGMTMIALNVKIDDEVVEHRIIKH